MESMKSLVAIFLLSLVTCHATLPNGKDRNCGNNKCLDPQGVCASIQECFSDPCLVNSCPIATDCTANNCGGCYAIFTDELGEVIDSTQCQLEPQCPEMTQPISGAACYFQGTCCYGEETCCGQTHDKFCCSCFDGQTGCYYTDSCLGASCPTEECCDPALAPGTNGNAFCMNGYVCCPDGSWTCGNVDGSFSCGDARGEVCPETITMAQNGGLEREILDYLNVSGKVKQINVVTVAIVIMSAILVLSSCACFCCLRRNRKKRLQGHLYDKVCDKEEHGGEKAQLMCDLHDPENAAVILND
mmetsp:Transcript_47602/g.78993  ORF Transcript_47602/g.78993 Transcript_47602/m.78993 type:complete len:301 (-) Transcript_47602:130-1032(-)